MFKLPETKLKSSKRKPKTSSKKITRMEICTVGKVGSKTIWESAKTYTKLKINHIHSLFWLRKRFIHQKNTITVVGIRNPLDRNLSWFFECYDKSYRNDLKIRTTNYKGEMLFFCERDEICYFSANEIISHFFKRTYLHDNFNHWFNEFFEITKIDKQSFDKEKGYQLYKFPNNNFLFLYTLEKLNQNEKEICELFGFEKLIKTNDANEKIYREKYNEVKEKITFSENYKKKLLHTPIMDFFYSKKDIKDFYNKYPTSKVDLYTDLKPCPEIFNSNNNIPIKNKNISNDDDIILPDLFLLK